MNHTEMEDQDAHADGSTERRLNEVREADAREQMVAARREQQRLNILRNLNRFRH
jgi:hypothetical protein